MWRTLMEQTEMKQVLIFCEYCEHRIHFHDLFRRNGQAFYHGLCWELYLLGVSEKGIAFKQGHTHHAGPQPSHRSNGDRYL